ncbi:Bug family tripartite tricarboxylate transporter substrate binding protein [Falsiroseomonas sp. HW251]|uniref:Bug family tripartite tricarboxylate transporter substrate binding protein n=1 Tax=Falsiroseomonas sp. HW251 TaxID=3390998 RepID=UPI003D30FCC9
MTDITRRMLGALAAGAVVPGAARAQAPWPSRSLRWIVPYAAGGGSDFLGRTLAAAVGTAIGQTIVVENRGGGATIPASEMAARSAPDGYTLLSADLTALVITPAMARRLSYDPIRDFRPVAPIARFPYVILVNVDLPVRTAAELIALVKARPNALNFAHAGTGTPNHLGTERLIRATGIQVSQVAYRGGAPAVTDLIAGVVQASVSDYASAAPAIQGGRVRAIAVPSPQRLALLPDVPTLAEQGITGADVYSWQGVVVPTGTPDAIVSRLQVELDRALRDPEIAQRLRSVSLEPFPGTSEQMRELIATETQIWAPLIRELGLTLDS